MGDNTWRCGFALGFLMESFLFGCMTVRLATSDVLCSLATGTLALMCIVVGIIIRYGNVE